MHGIDMSNNRANMAYVGAAPWHRLGTPVSPGQSPEQIQIAAGLLWRAVLAPIYFTDANQDAQTVPNRAVVYRDDTGAALGVVSDRYKLVQPGEVLEFFHEFVTAGDLEFETAGSLLGGRRIWALAKLSEHFKLKGKDLIESYLLLATSMDGSMATTATFTSVRVVCLNTLGFADRAATNAVRVPHIQTYDPSAIKQELGLINAPWRKFTEQADVLADRRVSDKEALEWLRTTFGEDPRVSLDEQPNQKVLKAVWKSVKDSPGAQLSTAEGTAWGLLQGATHYVDHVRGKSDDSRLNAAWFGAGATIKRKAFNSALALVA